MKPPDPLLTGRRGARGLEIQIHPADIRRRVRHFFLGRAVLTAWCLFALAFTVYVTLALALAPGVVRGLFSSQEYQGLVAERVRQGERLQALVGKIAQVAERTRGLGLEAAKVRLAYGLGNPPARPAAPRPSPPPVPIAGSIYADAIEQGGRLQARMEADLALLDLRLGGVEAFERSHPDRPSTTPAACPLKRQRFVLTSGFAMRRSPFTKMPEFHPGVDLAASPGTLVSAPADGTVVFAGQFPPRPGSGWWRYGNLVLIKSGDNFYTAFGHLAEIRVRRGEKLRRGAVLGTVGSSGWSTSPHLHYEIQRLDPALGDFRPVDPRIYILDHQWPNEERLLLGVKNGPRPGQYDPLPVR